MDRASLCLWTAATTIVKNTVFWDVAKCDLVRIDVSEESVAPSSG
jgi:hypothetical protein